MTKTERAVIQKFINKFSDLDVVRDATLKNLQDMNEEHGDGHRWCSWEACLDGLAKTLGRDDIIYRRAKVQYETFLKASAQKDFIRDFGSALAEIGFWKEKVK